MDPMTVIHDMLDNSIPVEILPDPAGSSWQYGVYRFVGLGPNGRTEILITARHQGGESEKWDIAEIASRDMD